MTGPPLRTSGTPLLLVGGAVLVIVGVSLAAFGFLSLVMVLDRGGYRTGPMATAIVILGASGAALAAGIALLIWQFAKKYEANEGLRTKNEGRDSGHQDDRTGRRN